MRRLRALSWGPPRFSTTLVFLHGHLRPELYFDRTTHYLCRKGNLVSLSRPFDLGSYNSGTTVSDVTFEYVP